MIPTPSFVFSAKSQKRIAMACDLVPYYNKVGHDLNAANLQLMPVMKNFEIQWKALKERKDEDLPETPRLPSCFL